MKPPSRPLILFNRLKPWLLVASVFPALLLFNGAFLKIFPARTPQDAASANPFLPGNSLVQLGYIYNTRTPDAMFGNFYYTLGTQMAARGQILAAQGLLDKAVKLMPTNAVARLNYGVVLEALEKYEEALTQYQEAVKLDPKMVQAYYSMGLLYDKTGKTDTGIEALLKAAALEPDNNFINYDLGVLYSKKEDYANSALYSHKALKDAEEFAEAYNNYGYALAHLGRLDEALEAINKSLALKPDSAAALDSKGFALCGLQRYEEALEAYNQALKLDPTIAEIYLHKGEVFERTKEYAKAANAYETYLQLLPNAGNRDEIEDKIKQLKKWSTNKPS